MGMVRLEIYSYISRTLDTEGNSNKVVLEAQTGGDKTIRDILSELAMEYPLFGQDVFDIRLQKLTERVSIFLNSNLLVLENGLETRVNDGDVLTLMPMMEGG